MLTNSTEIAARPSQNLGLQSIVVGSMECQKHFAGNFT